MSSTPRTRKWWTEEEDRILRGEAERQLSKGAIKDWNSIAAKLHDRTNKDCRKRWSKVCGNVQKGAWSCVEDERLQNAVEQYGQKWTDVAEIVGTRYPEQCAKRWQHSLDPSVDHSEWTPEMDQRLMAAVEKFGRNWRAIGEREFRHRSTTDIKNRYVILKRRQRNKTEYTEADSSLRDVAEDISVLDATSMPDLADDAEFDMEDMDFDIEDLVSDSFSTHFPDTPASSSSRQGRRGDKSSLAETQIRQGTLINNHDALLPFLDSTINAWDNNTLTLNPEGLPETLSEGSTDVLQNAALQSNPMQLQFSDSTESPIFLIHDGSGQASLYSRLQNLNRDVFAFSDPCFPRNASKITSLEQMAEDYASCVSKSESPSLIIGGWSFGGVVAFQAAQLLSKAGFEVKGLLLIDSPYPRKHKSLPEEIIANILKAPSPERTEKQSNLITEFKENAALLAQFEPRDYDPREQAKIKTVYLRSQETFDTEAVCGVHYDWLSNQQARDTAVHGWEALVGGHVKVMLIPGNHFQPFDADNIAATSEQLKKACQYIEAS